VIGPSVTVGEETQIGSHVLIDRSTHIGDDCRISHGAVLGTDPQDLKFKGEPTVLVVGDRTVIREYATLNRGTSASGKTTVGSDCLLMAYVHVAHDCVIGNHVIISNSTQLAGHVVIEDWAVVSGLTGIPQFIRIGAHSFTGSDSKLTQNVPPYCRVSGNPAKLYGLNSVGLDRRGFSPDVRKALKQSYRILFLSGLNTSQGMARVEAEVDPIPEVLHLLEFIRSSERGIIL
jgi:UDP-N-acetylglucosamine acyltransferase